MPKANSKKRNIKERECDSHLLIQYYSGKFKLPVWFAKDGFTVVCQLTNGMEIVHDSQNDFKKKKSKDQACEEIRNAIAELDVENISIHVEQKKFYSDVIITDPVVG